MSKAVFAEVTEKILALSYEQTILLAVHRFISIQEYGDSP